MECITDDDIKKLEIIELRNKLRSKGIKKGGKDWEDVIKRRRQLRSRDYQKHKRERELAEVAENEEKINDLQDEINGMQSLEVLENTLEYWKTRVYYAKRGVFAK